MTKDEQTIANLNLQFISYAKAHGKLYWLNDTKQKRIIAVPSKKATTSLFYGALFLCEDYENNKHKLHSYYNNSIPYTNATMKEDLYDFSKIIAIPILFSNLKDIEKNNYKMGEPVECACFVANSCNENTRYAISKPYHRMKSVDAKSFIKLVKEKSNGRS